jgi:hypothetical protein
MRGVQFVVDEGGRKTAVIIDLRHQREMWEDFYDLRLAQEREDEPRESLDDVRARLERRGKLPVNG